MKSLTHFQTAYTPAQPFQPLVNQALERRNSAQPALPRTASAQGERGGLFGQLAEVIGQADQRAQSEATASESAHLLEALQAIAMPAQSEKPAQEFIPLMPLEPMAWSGGFVINEGLLVRFIAWMGGSEADYGKRSRYYRPRRDDDKSQIVSTRAIQTPGGPARVGQPVRSLLAPGEQPEQVQGQIENLISASYHALMDQLQADNRAYVEALRAQIVTRHAASSLSQLDGLQARHAAAFA